MMPYLVFISRISVLLLSIWALYVTLTAFTGLKYYFPLQLAETEAIPLHRLEAVRCGTFLTLAYFGMLFVLKSEKQLYPIQFIKVFFLLYSFSGFILFYNASVAFSEYVLLVFFLVCAFIIHVSTRDHLKKYFYKK